MKIDLIAIGNELLNGKVQDLNTYSLAQLCYRNGHELRKVHLIQDDYSSFELAVDEASKHSDCIITSGGLGPTKDDKTKKFYIKYFQQDNTHSLEALKTVTKQYSRGGKEYPINERDYHFLPVDFSPIYNPAGYAPGFHLKKDNCLLFATPGVPSEFQAMLTEEIFPALQTSTSITKHIIFKTKGIPEANIFNKQFPNLWKELEVFGEVSSLPHLLGVDIGVKITSNSKTELLSLENKVLDFIQTTTLTQYIWHTGAESLEEVIIQEAKAKKLTIGFAESCTGGLLAHKLTNTSGSSAVFWGSIVSYSNQVKTNCLNVNKETLKNYGAVSKQTALEMATGARKNLNIDISVTTTGVAGPGGGSEEKPVGTVAIGYATNTESNSEVFYFNGNRKTLKEKFARAALFKMLELIRKH